MVSAKDGESREDSTTIGFDGPRVDVANNGGVALDLLVSSAAGASIVSLEPGETIIGRQRHGASLAIDDPSLSRKHARLELTASGLTLEDLESRNGTFADGVPLSPGTPMALASRSSFRLGAVTFVLTPRRAQLAQTPATAEIVVEDAAMKQLYEMLAIVSATPLSVLLLGETGVGKEVFAERIHALSTRAAKPLLRINCASFPESMLEGELFGYEKGAFTGAAQAKAGLFESADGGTVFLDEVGEMPLPMQAKLLRVVETREVMRIGSLRPRTVDVRFIAATHRDLWQAAGDGTFRSDLYYRLNGMSLTVPPLRQRVADIVPLAQFFAERMAAQLGRPVPRLAPETCALLQAHPWDGNVRELRNTIERAVVLASTSGVVTAEHVVLDRRRNAPSRSEPRIEERESRDTIAPPLEDAGSYSERAAELQAAMRDLERDRLTAVLAEFAGNQTAAARKLGLSRTALIARMEQFGLHRPRRPR